MGENNPNICSCSHAEPPGCPHDPDDLGQRRGQFNQKHSLFKTYPEPTVDKTRFYEQNKNLLSLALPLDRAKMSFKELSVMPGEYSGYPTPGAFKLLLTMLCTQQKASLSNSCKVRLQEEWREEAVCPK